MFVLYRFWVTENKRENIKTKETFIRFDSHRTYCRKGCNFKLQSLHIRNAKILLKINC